jgi:quercetin dioxygenase-like cupin family protein
MYKEGFNLKLENIPEITTPDKVALKIPVHPEVTGQPVEAPISLFVITFPPGTSSPSHFHESDEYEYVLSGKGLLETENGKRVSLEPDTIVYNPKKIIHKVTNNSKEPLKVLKIHVPPIVPLGASDILTARAINAAKEAFKKL